MQKGVWDKPNVSCLSRCPYFRGVLNEGFHCTYLTTTVHAYWHATSSDDSAEQFKEGCTCGFMPWEFRHYHAKYICMWTRA